MNNHESIAAVLPECCLDGCGICLRSYRPNLGRNDNKIAGLCCLSRRSAYKTRERITDVLPVRPRASSGPQMSLCSAGRLGEVMTFLTFRFSITKFSHVQQLQHPDGMTNSLNRPQDVIVSARKALGLCLD